MVYKEKYEKVEKSFKNCNSAVVLAIIQIELLQHNHGCLMIKTVIKAPKFH